MELSLLFNFKNIFKMKFRKKLFGKFYFLILALSLLATLNGCKKSDNSPSSPPANEVWMQNNSFNPSTITVSANTTITWRNKDSVTHTVTSTTSAFDSGNIAAGGTYSRQFMTAGTYSYHCTIHSNMNGQVVVN
jgi:plastocyanin